DSMANPRQHAMEKMCAQLDFRVDRPKPRLVEEEIKVRAHKQPRDHLADDRKLQHGPDILLKIAKSVRWARRPAAIGEPVEPDRGVEADDLQRAVLAGGLGADRVPIDPRVLL